MKFTVILLTAVLFSISNEVITASTGDTIHVITHSETKVVTDPAKGYNAYKSWGVFPSGDIKYRKAVLFVTYQCPDNQRCGEWDYIDNIYLRRKGSVSDTSLDIELARMISPYGSRFTPDWKFRWKIDITDFSFLLQDSVEIEFNHTGYESNTDRGWLVTLDFELTEGPPVMEVLGYEKLWTGTFPYGDSRDDIENYLKPFAFENKYGADIARVRILQTGHGMDDFENCAEFCNRYRKLFFNNELVEQKQIWRECADNPLYPQAGTWIFDRAGWCPGAMVNPDLYDFKITDSSDNIIDIEMEPYVNPNKPSANYVFSSYLFYYKKPEKVHDLTIEELISPSDEDIYSKDNPLCMDGKVLIRNNGAEATKEWITIVYGFGEYPLGLAWVTGSIKPGELVYRTLPKMFTYQPNYGMGEFTLRIKEVNIEDEYPLDNSKTVFVEVPPVWDRDIKISYRTNKNPLGTILSMKDNYKNEYLGWKPDKPDTLYEFYFENLNPGCYEFTIKDTANDGLDFWFNPEGGYGYVRVTDKEGKLIKAFDSDFGSEIRHQFLITGEEAIKEDITPILNIFPIRNPGKFFCDIFLNEKQNVTLEITTEDKRKTVYKKKLKNFKDGIIDVDISKEPDGFYFVNVTSGKKSSAKKIKVKRD